MFILVGHNEHEDILGLFKSKYDAYLFLKDTHQPYWGFRIVSIEENRDYVEVDVRSIVGEISSGLVDLTTVVKAYKSSSQLCYPEEGDYAGERATIVLVTPEGNRDLDTYLDDIALRDSDFDKIMAALNNY